MNTEQFLPTRWILKGVERKVFADHLRNLRKLYHGRELARACQFQVYWVGIIPPSPARMAKYQETNS